ncbi:MAG: hypothetical protein ACI9VR_004193 [Cognaticolwellia sp.]|jgi:hypothetical protein
MDKTRKLKRYRRKDYSQVVDFPVEIVGRDGVVRRYSFESSVRLYQRRIASAPGRYGDAELVYAEVQHCRHRIKQLRASYLRRHGFSDLGVQSQNLGDLAGEVTAFLRRCFGSPASLLVLQPLDDQAWGQSWYLEQPQSGVAYLLSLYPFEHYGACEGREAFFETLRVLRGSKGDQVEALVAFHHSGDCGLVLTCQGVHADMPLSDDSPELIDEESRSGPWAEGLRALAEEDLSSALACFEEAQLSRPFARRIAVACGSIADMLGEFASAETSARIGLNAFPDDPVLRYQLALAQVRGGELRGARVSLERCPKRQRLPQAELLKGIIALREGRIVAAQAPLAEAGRNHRMQELEAWVWGLRLRSWALVAFATVSLVAFVFAGANLAQAFVLGCVLAICTSLLSLAGTALLWWSIKLRLSNETLAALRLPPAEAIGASGPHLGDLVD